VQELFATGRVADLVLAVLILEAMAILALYRLTRRGPGLARVLPFLLAGACLLLAWRTAGAGLPWPVPALLLLGAGVAHLVDLLQRRL
jgi:hypothetical protein